MSSAPTGGSMDPNAPNDPRNAPSQDQFARSWAWWSSDIPYLPPHDQQAEGGQQFVSTPSPAAFHTPLSDSYLLHSAAASPYSYHASPPHWQSEPVLRSMSVSAIPTAAQQTLQSHPGPFLPPPRQIRFVSTDGQPHTKRRRINAACLTCRKRKTRCSGERPECKTCVGNGHVCAGYAEKPQQKDEDKNDDDDDDGDGDDDEGSSDWPPKRTKRESAPSVNAGALRAARVPRMEKQNSIDSASSARSVAREEVGDMRSPASNNTANSSATSTARNRVPYFRYFGPTAIVPGFKQMVVQVKDNRRSIPSVTGDSPAAGGLFDSSSAVTLDRPPMEIPFYDATDPAPNAPLIVHLCEVFFTHLGCNYPFLQRERFMRDLEEKRVDAILVDAVCAVAARFSSDPTLATPSDHSVPLDANGKDVRKAFRGHQFAQRAMSAVVDTFACPTMAVTQACILLAYEEFGTDHDSGLWMYLGTAIRMAQDLGIQKLEGLQLEGRIGPTPKTAKHGQEGKAEEARRAEQQQILLQNRLHTDLDQYEDRRASEQERIDTFWGIFFLDRAVSSGVGRPVTLRDKDIEISFPYRPDETMINGYPHPYPPLIRIVHMYGRVADVLNNIKDVSQVTPEVLKRLASMEKDLTGIYQRLSPKLHFNATNFQHYVKADQGTNFILLHFWFHTLIVLLHQPTLLHSFEGRIQQLFPDSRELSMSSAKTIADILAFAELIDVKSFIGNPFTSQPMYVAACAFLAEAAAHASQPSSRCTTPPAQGPNSRMKTEVHEPTDFQQRAASAKHTLLATAANQNYQRCYKALKVLDTYWAGCRYILTALDGRSKGLSDPLLFTSDDVDGEMPSTEPSFTTPGWRRSTSHSASMGGPGFDKLRAMRGSHDLSAWSPQMDWSQAIGWSLTGTTNSPAPNISFLYPNTSADGEGRTSPMIATQKMQQATGQGPPAQPQKRPQKQTNGSQRMDMFATPDQTLQSYGNPSKMMPPPRNPVSSLPRDPVSTAEADLLLGLHSPYSVNSATHNTLPQTSTSGPLVVPSTFDYAESQGDPHQPMHNFQQGYMTPHSQEFSNMLIESQDVDMVGSNGSFPFPGGDLIPWLEYLPQDVLNYFGDPQDDASLVMPSGPGPPPGENG